MDNLDYIIEKILGTNVYHAMLSARFHRPRMMEAAAMEVFLHRNLMAHVQDYEIEKLRQEMVSIGY